ncbi:MAG TPA: DDE-type integrase/transposase/recombinase [Candidatus Polarisedimenticolaceae bacterium]|nr:DDE-type integrase/transposase/recombinase [Candidatus Polarisedimenticolaceae bacterium]
MERLPAQRRPHYPPIERLAILELRAARGWTVAETARRLLVTSMTVTSWNSRLDEEGPDALLKVPVPVNRFPDFVAYVVRRLRALCPSMGTRRIARVLARAGLHLGRTTVRRMLQPAPKRPKQVATRKPERVVTARGPNHVWHTDLTTVPTGFGFWIPWLPLALPQRWPFCWWVAIAVDHYSRRVLGTAVFLSEPSARDITQFLGRVCRRWRCRPGHLITDHGPQFTADEFGLWCSRRRIRQRFGAVGKYGSIAVIERSIRSVKRECTRVIHVALRPDAFQRELEAYVAWFNAERPHTFLGGATPDEVYFKRMPACRKPRLEPRVRWPRRSPCASPHALVRGRPGGAAIELDVRSDQGRAHLPIVTLRRAA